MVSLSNHADGWRNIQNSPASFDRFRMLDAYFRYRLMKLCIAKGVPMTVLALILAAGLGKRMHSKLPKVLHPIAGRPMLDYAIRTAAAVTGATPYVVVGHAADQVRQVAGDTAHYVLQPEQLGTGHAVLVARDALAQASTVLVLYGDTPF